jgi:branched-chain amino acid aminotransferase
VVPDSKNVIESVTADSVCEIARRVFGWKVEKRAVSHLPSSLFLFLPLLFTPLELG